MREQPGRHRGCDERDDGQVDDGRQDGQPTERDKHDRQGRRLCRERDAEALGEPARQAATPGALDPRRQRRRPGDQAGGCERRQLEPRIARSAPDRREEQHRGPAERGRRPPRPARSRARAARPRPSRRPGRPRPTPPRRRRTRRSRRSSRPIGGAARARARPSPRPPQRRSRCSSPRWRRRGSRPAVVNAAARSRSTRSRRPIEDPGRETGLGLRQDRRQRVSAHRAGAASMACAGSAGAVLDRHRPRRQRADRADPFAGTPRTANPVAGGSSPRGSA